MRNSNSFTEVFSENHNIRYSAKQLEYLEKHTALFLLNLFTGVYQNHHVQILKLTNFQHSELKSMLRCYRWFGIHYIRSEKIDTAT